MSYDVMRIVGTSAIVAIIAGAVVYGCGPGTIIGGVGSIGTGSAVLVEKVQLMWNQRALKYARSDQAIIALNMRISALEISKKQHQHLAKVLAISAIPIFGPFWALKDKLR